MTTYTVLNDRNVERSLHIEEDGDHLLVQFTYDPFLLKLIKGCEAATWIPADKTWRIKKPSVSERTDWILSFLFRQPVYQIFKDKHDNIQPNRETLYDYQVEDFSNCINKRIQLLALEMGLGKTLIGIEVMEHLKNKYNWDDTDFWVVAPLSAIRAWKDELPKWKSKVHPRLVHCNHDSLERMMRHIEIPPKCIIIDEISRFKNSGSKRTQLIKQITRQVRQHKDHYIIGMSGTPAPKDPSNWHSEIEILRPGYIIERDANQLKQRLAKVEHEEGPNGAYPVLIEWKEQEIVNLSNRLKGLVSVRFKKDYLQLPEKIYQEVTLPTNDEILRDAQFIIDTSKTTIEALQKLRQFSDGFSYKSNTEFTTPKDEQLIDDLESLESRVVIFAGYQASIDKIVKICNKEGWSVIRVDGRGWQAFSHYQDFKPTLDHFNNYPEKVAFVGHPKAGGMGITLTASQIIIYYSNDFDGEARTQSEDRIHRIGTKGALIKDYLWLPTDKFVLDNLKKKRKLELLSLGELKEGLKI